VDLTDMPGIDPDIICHKLSIKADAKLVKQKPRRINEEQSRSISDEVDHLLQLASFESPYTLTGSPILSS